MKQTAQYFATQSYKIIARVGLFGGLLIAALAVGAQVPRPPASAPSPAVEALQNSHSAAVSPFTGSATANVPLYTLREGDIEIPITMRYAAQGFRPEESPGNLGMGWNVELGGVISRTVNDLPDEFTLETRGTAAALSNEPRSRFYHAGLLWSAHPAPAGASAFPFADWWNADWEAKKRLAARDFVPDPFSGSSGFPESNPVVQGHGNVLDTEPDEFSFSFAGYSGKFYLSPAHLHYNIDMAAPRTWSTNAQMWQVKCDRPIRVELLYAPQGRAYSFNNTFSPSDLAEVPFPRPRLLYYDLEKQSGDGEQPRTFYGFQITTDQGVKYTFGTTPHATEYSTSRFRQLDDHWTASAWHLTHVTYPSGQTVEYQYEAQGAGVAPGDAWMHYHYLQKLSYSGQRDVSLVPIPPSPNTPPPNSPSASTFPFDPSLNVDGLLVRPAVLVAIRFPATGTRMDIASTGRKIPTSVNKSALQLNRCGIGWAHCSFTGDVWGVNLPIDDAMVIDELTVTTPSHHPYPYPSVAPTVAEVKRLRFVYSPATTTQSVNTFLRPYLRTVQDVGRANGVRVLYDFTYYPNPRPNEPLPPAFDGETDHWGFYNNAFRVAQPSYISGQPKPVSWANASALELHRAPMPISPANLALARMGMLHTITSEIGEQTTFEYEQHEYGGIYDRTYGRCLTYPGSNAAGTPGYTGCIGGYRTTSLRTNTGPTGGVRLARITRASVSGAGSAPQSVSFNYDIPGVSPRRSSGWLASEIVYFSSIIRYHLFQPAGTQLVCDKAEVSYVTINPLMPIQSGSGAHIGYSTITETYDDEAQKRATFSNYDTEEDGFDDDPLGGAGPAGPYTVNDEQRGRLLQEEWFGAPNASGVRPMIRKRVLTYEKGFVGFSINLPGNAVSQWNTKAYSVRIGARQYAGRTTVNNYWLLDGIQYSSLLGSSRLKQEVTTEVEDTTPKVTTRTLSYQNRGLLAEEKVTSPGAPALATAYTYPTAFLGVNLAGADWLLDMLTSRQYNLPVAVVKYKSGYVVDATGYTYQRGMRRKTMKYNIAQRTDSAAFTHFLTIRPGVNNGPRYVEQTLNDWREIHSQQYAPHTNVPEQTNDAAEGFASVLWGRKSTVPVATFRHTNVLTGGMHDCAFENFEGDLVSWPYIPPNSGVMPGSQDRFEVTNWRWISQTGGVPVPYPPYGIHIPEYYSVPQFSPVAHTGKYSLSAPNLHRYNTSWRPGRAVVPPVAAADSVTGPAARERPIPCIIPAPPFGAGPAEPTTRDSLMHLAYGALFGQYGESDPPAPIINNPPDPFWCLQTDLRFSVADEGPRTFKLSCWARVSRKQEGDPTQRTSRPFVALWGATCETLPYLEVVPDDGKWHCVTYQFTTPGDAGNLAVLVGGNNVLIDDLLLLPIDARVTTYTHEPHVGVTSIIDETNHTTFYEYDEFGRLRATFDDDGNLLQATDYKLRQP